MSTLRKIAEAKKERIRAAADRQIAEIDSDLEKLEALAAKYGLSVVEPVPTHENMPEAPEATEPSVPSPPPVGNGNGLHITEAEALAQIASALAVLSSDASISKRARTATKAYIRAKNRPVPLAELDQALTASGVQFELNSPRSVLSAVLGQDRELRSISRSLGWWFSEEPLPITRPTRRLFS